MKINIGLTIVLVGMLVSCNAQQIQSRQVAEFSRISVSDAIQVTYTDSDTSAVTVKCKSASLEKIDTKVEDGTLLISSNGTNLGEVIVSISSKKLQALQASGASSFKVLNEISSEQFELNATGSADIQIKFKGKLINCTQGGASSVNLKGQTDSLIANITGASSFKSYGLSSKNVRISSSGASNAKVYATETMKANATGASEIKIKGEPRELSAEASIASSITRVHDASSIDPQDGNDTTTYQLKKRKIIVINQHTDDNEKDENETSWKHWKGFSMGVNGYYNADGGLNMKTPNKFMEVNYARSFNFQFNIIERQFDIVHDYFKVVTGFGFDYHLYEFANHTTLNPDTAYTWGTIAAEDGSTYLKNKLRATYLQVPLLLEFNTSSDPEKTWHIGVGVVGQYLISSRTKQQVEKDGNKEVKWKKDSYNLNPFGAKAHVNVGYRGWMVFGEYNLTSLFQPGKGPELYPFTAGIRLVPFS